MTQETIEQLLEELITLHKDWDLNAEAGKASTESFPKMKSLSARILNQLVWNPGTLIYFKEGERLADAMKATDWIWKEYIDIGALDFLDIVTTGVRSGETDYSAIGAELRGVYAERAKMLRPTFVSVDLPVEVRSYFREAMDAWVRGLDCAALILSWSVIEKIMKEVLLTKDKALVLNLKDGGEIKAAQLIENARHVGFLLQPEADAAHRVRQMRNDAVHRLEKVSAESSFKAIVQTKQIVERLFRRT